MINYIRIKNFAIIEETEIHFNKGLNIITGETGAGKSIIVEAIALALGSRADSSLVRSGCDKAIVQMVAEYMHQEYIITREISSCGKNLCKINSDVVTLSELQKLTEKIADIHGQYDNQSLLNAKNHINLVDTYEKGSISACKEKVKDLFNDYKNILKALKELQEKSSQYETEKDEMEFQRKEIVAAKLILGEDEDLKERIKEAHSKEQIFNSLTKAYEIANGEDFSVLNQLYEIQNCLKDAVSGSKTAQDVSFELSDLYYKFEDIIGKIRYARDRIIFSNDDLDMLQERLDLIERLKRKHNMDINELLNHAALLKKKLNNFKDMEEEIEGKNLERERIGEMLKRIADKLTELRTIVAKNLEENIQKELQDLNLKEAKVNFSVFPLGKYTSNGQDKIEFLISTNPGEPLKPLNKIASGGEMSRIMLAFKSIIGEYDGIGTMIFDEVDSGISGMTANKVAKKLKSIASKHQVIAITHLPQIAALGDHNYKIEKKSYNFTTNTKVLALNDKEKTVEIARLLSGDSISETAIENAKALIGNK